jgi:hypothetical protein
VTDGRYVYVANYLPHIPAGQHNAYMFETPTTRAWKKLFDEGKLTPQQAQYWRAPRSPEELYDLQTDPDEVNNLAGSPLYEQMLERFRAVQWKHAADIHDVGLLPEGEMHARARGSAPYEAGHAPAYDVDRVLAAAKLAGAFNANAIPELIRRLRDDDSAVRYWAATGLLIRGQPAVRSAAGELKRAMDDESPDVRVAAAHALARYGTPEHSEPALLVLLELSDLKRNGIHVSVAALNAIDALDDRAASARDAIAALPDSDPAVIDKMKEYVPRLKEAILADLK